MSERIRQNFALELREKVWEAIAHQHTGRPHMAMAKMLELDGMLIRQIVHHELTYETQNYCPNPTAKKGTPLEKI
jgi:hypothetical protein